MCAPEILPHGRLYLCLPRISHKSKLHPPRRVALVVVVGPSIPVHGSRSDWVLLEWGMSPWWNSDTDLIELGGPHESLYSLTVVPVQAAAKSVGLPSPGHQHQHQGSLCEGQPHPAVGGMAPSDRVVGHYQACDVGTLGYCGRPWGGRGGGGIASDSSLKLALP